ncbi:MAG: glycosyltransferase family 39 protein [Candidatus Omnitrophota bacterium]|jgi:hypothetical protein
MTAFGLNTRQLIVAAGVLLFALVIQTSRINRPFVGHFASYQGTVMASIARNMVRENFSEIFLPKTDALIFQSRRPLHLNQYPLPSLLAAIGFKLFGGGLEFWGRFQAVIFNALTLFLVMLIATRMFDRETGTIAAVIFGLSPYTLIYGQAFMSEAAGVFFLMTALVLIARPGKSLSVWRVALSGLLFSASLVNRVHFVLFFPAYLYLLITRQSNGRDAFWKGLLFAVSCFLLPALWYGFTFFATYFFDNIHTTLFMQMGSSGAVAYVAGIPYLVRVFEIVGFRILTPLLVPFFLLGFWRFPNNVTKVFLFFCLLGGFLILILFPEKVTAHDFYLYGVFPFAAIWTASVVARVLSRFKNYKWRSLGIIIGVLFYVLLSIRLFANPLYATPAKEMQAVKIAKNIQPLLREADILIVGGRQSPVFNYYAEHPSWSMDANILGQPMSGYLKSAFAPSSYSLEAMRMKTALKDLRSWFEYLRDKGATVIVFPDKKKLDSHYEFANSLRESVQVLSSNSDSYFLARIIQRRASS